MEEERIRYLLQVGDVRRARALVSTDDWDMKEWRDLLDPPTVERRPASAASGFDANQAWVRAHADEFKGHWVALRAGVLLGHDPSRVVLHQRLKERGPLTDSLFVKLD